MSSNRFPQISELVTNYIRDQDPDENDGVPGRELVQHCRVELCDQLERWDREMIEKFKREIAASVNRMVAEGVLHFLRKEGKVLFRLPKEQLTDDTIILQRDRDAEEAETSILEEEMPDDQTEEDRHAAGYAEMIRGARPLVEPPAAEDISTPSRKRRRLEVAASDSSSWNSLSPSRHTNSTPRRRPPPPASPLSGSRRRSVPMQFFSPTKPRDTTEYQLEDCLRQGLFKHEKKDNSPGWMVQGLDVLRSRYPDDHFKAENGLMICLDCDRSFKPPQACNVSNFETHLKSRGHKIVVKKNREDGITHRDPLPYTKHVKHIDINCSEQQAPYMVFAHKTEQNLAEIRQKYLAALESDSHAKTMKLALLDSRLSETDRRSKEQSESFDKLLQTSQRNSKDMKEKFNLVQDVINSMKDKYEEQTRGVTELLEVSDSKNSELIKGMKKQIVDFEETCDAKLDDTNTRVAKNFQRTSDQYDKIKEQFTKSELISKTKLEQLSAQISQLREKSKSQDEEIAKLQLQAQEHVQEVQNVKLHSKKLEVEIGEMKEANRLQNDEIQDLLAQSQLHTEELQRQRESDQSFRRTMTDQMEAHIQQTERLINKIKTGNEELLKATEQKFLDSIKSVKEQYTQKVKSLEKGIAKQNANIERFETVIPAILADAQDMKEFMDEIANTMNNMNENEVVQPSP